MTLWFILALMTTAAIFAVLWPLSRRAEGRRSGSDVVVYQDQLDELARDRAAGLIPPADAEAARVEVARRLIAAVDAAASPADIARTSLTNRCMAMLMALIALPASSVALYLMLGSPLLPAAPLAARRDVPTEQRSIGQLIAQVEAHLERKPEDGRGWEVLAPVYMRLGRFDDAVKARANALRLNGANAVREADYGEVLVAAATASSPPTREQRSSAR